MRMKHTTQVPLWEENTRKLAARIQRRFAGTGALGNVEQKKNSVGRFQIDLGQVSDLT